MKTIIVIGNGFDIDLGWRTSYKDFYDSKKDEWNKFRTDEDDLFQYVIKNAGENWYDLERTIYNYCIAMSKELPSEEKMRKDLEDYKNFKNQLVHFIKQRSAEQVKEKSYAYHLLKFFIEQRCPQGFYNEMDSEWFSFNYTPLDKVARQINPSVVFNYTAIHGTLENNNCIFGFHDDKQIKGQYRLIQKSLDDDYEPHVIYPALSEADRFIFFGLSMGFIDAVYFKDIFEQISKPINSNNRTPKEIIFITRDKGSMRDIKMNLQDIGINIQSLMTNNKVNFILTSTGFEENTINNMFYERPRSEGTKL